MSWKTIGIIGAVLFSIIGGYIFTDWYRVLPEDSVAHFVGRDSCIQCHQNEADLFHGSHHDLAMDVANSQTVLANFDDQTLTSFGVETRFYRDGEKYMVRTEGPSGAMEDFEVKYVFGVTPLQQYMIEFDRPEGMAENEVARVQVLSICWDTEGEKWFQLQPPDVKEKIEPGDPLHWTGRTQCWNTSCADCHSTDLKKNFDLKTLTYHTTFSEIDVSCEACHGPGSQHVEMAKSNSIFWDRKKGYGLARLKGEQSTAQIETCAKCHSRRGGIREGFCGGRRYHDHYTSELLTEQTYHDDGQIKDEVYVYGSFLQSKMYHEGIRCTDCHDPHSTKVKFDTNQLCTSCHAHPAGKYDVPSHHRHQTGSTGAKCVECHMPATTYMHVDPRRDHSLRIPRPDLSVKHGTPNACTQCHIDATKLPEKERQLLEGKQYLDWLNLAKENNVVADELARLDQWSQESVSQWHTTENQTAHFGEAFAGIRKDGGDQSAYNKLKRMISDRKIPDIVRGTAALELTRNSDEVMKTVNRAFQGSAKELMSPALKQLQKETSVLAIQGFLQTIEYEIGSLLTATWKYQSLDGNAQPRIDYSKLVEPLRNYVTTLLQLHRHERLLVRIEAARVLLRIPVSVLDQILDSREMKTVKTVFDQLIESVKSNQERGSALLALGSIYQLKANVNNFERHTMDPLRVQESDQYFELARQAYRDAARVAPDESGARGNLAAMNDELIQRFQLEARRLQQSGDTDGLVRIAKGLRDLEETNTLLRKQELAVLGKEATRAYQSRVGAAVIDRYAMALYVDGQVNRCEEELRKAIELSPDDAMIVLHYALILEKQEKYPEALQYAEKLLILVPNDPSYKLKRDELAAKIKN